MTSPLILALPKGRILKEFLPLLEKVGVKPEADFFNEKTRSLQFKTNHPALEIIVVRSFDVATFVAFGAAHLGVAGNDVLLEFDHSEIYAPVDLKIGKCRLSVAEKIETFEGTFKKPFIGMSGEKENFSETQAYSSVRADSETFSDAANRPRKEVFRDARELCAWLCCYLIFFFFRGAIDIKRLSLAFNHIATDDNLFYIFEIR
jgi:hypothetical protein